jgi:hypothetical protein
MLNFYIQGCYGLNMGNVPQRSIPDCRLQTSCNLTWQKKGLRGPLGGALGRYCRPLERGALLEVVGHWGCACKEDYGTPVSSSSSFAFWLLR